MKSLKICYCFGYTADDILRDIQKNGESTLLERIEKERAAGNCRCAENHPEKR